MNQQVFNGNNIDLLKNYPDNYFDAVVTDPPYGLSKEPNASELMKDWIEKGYHEISGKGFMGKEWDAFVPQPIFWKEVFRVLKPGGHVLAFYGTRTYDWGVMAMRLAGFEVRDCIQWLYGSGFPKSHNIGKALDKMEGAERKVIGTRGLNSYKTKKDGNSRNKGLREDFDKINQLTAPSTEAAKQWDGWGTALKPANEPIVLARKPLEKGLSIAENILKWGVGGINIDASRIGFNEYDKGDYITKRLGYKEGFEHKQLNGKDESSVLGKLDYNEGKETKIFNNQGRFPANIILTHHEDCVCKGTKKVKGSIAIRENGASGFNGGLYNGAELGKSENFGYTDKNGNEVVENWDCHEDCPIRILDEQSGVLKSGQLKYESYTKERDNNSIFAGGGNFIHKGYSADKGGASRFFYVAKASKNERNKGVDDSNFHPTVKPIKLMQYLVKMITPTNGIVLDPFCGSGTTGIACKIDEFNFVGLEQDLEYYKIAEARINNYKLELKQIDLF